MRSLARVVCLFVMASLLSNPFARGDTPTQHVSMPKSSCSGMGYCARMSNGGVRTMPPPPISDPTRFNAIDGEPIH